MRAEPHVIYEVGLKRLLLELEAGSTIDVSHALSNGRANYIMFEKLVGDLIGLSAGTQGRGSDLSDASTGEGYEVKAFLDRELHPTETSDLFHTSASVTFPPNNKGPEIRALLKDDDYQGALKICSETGFDNNDFYIYTNTKNYNPIVPLRFIIVPTPDVLRLLSRDDPRLISRDLVLGLASKTIAVPETWLQSL